MTTLLEITCRDPIVARDGRPFGAGQGNRMRSLDWPLPSVVAGSLRSTLGKFANKDFSSETAEDLLRVEVAGPLPFAGGQLYLPAPLDGVVHPEQGLVRMAPQAAENGHCDWPAPGLRPVLPAEDEPKDDFKPGEAPAWWPEEHYAAWLAGDAVGLDDRFFGSAELEQRTHVSLDPATGAAEEGHLFTTSALALSHLPRHGISSEKARSSRFVVIILSARVRAEGWCGEAAAKLHTLHPLGGERRLAHWKAAADATAWICPKPVREALTKASRIRMVLATPANFAGGWMPGWLNGELVGTPPGAEVVLRLVGVSIERWKAVSGWSLAKLPGQPRGPKPVRRMVPAGGVYFFELVDGEASKLADRWLEPVSDDVQDRHDGFGLAAWGVW